MTSPSSRPGLRIAHLYPRDMNIYGDLGNVITLVQRLRWRGFTAEVVEAGSARDLDLGRVDLLFGGGGQDSGQLVIADDLVQGGPGLRAAIADGLPALVICGLYQLFGRGFRTSDGREVPGIGVFGATTTGTDTRMIGNIVVDSPRFGRLVGFENHSGATELEPGQQPLGRVVSGSGNTPASGHEGAVTGDCVGTYLHGPVLPKNPVLADALLLAALRRRHGVDELDPLDDGLERTAATAAAARPR